MIKQKLTITITKMISITRITLMGMSVGAAAAGIIAADFSAVHIYSPLQRSRWQRLPAAAQRF